MTANYLKFFKNVALLLQKADMEDLADLSLKFAASGTELNVLLLSSNGRINTKLLELLTDNVRQVNFSGGSTETEEAFELDELMLYELCPNLDICVLVLNASQPVTKSDLRIYKLLESILPADNIVLLVDRLEQVDKAELNEVKNYIGEKVNSFSAGSSPLFFISSLTGEGMDLFQQSLDNLAHTSERIKSKTHASKIKWLVKQGKEIALGEIGQIENWKEAIQGKRLVMKQNIQQLYRSGVLVNAFLSKQKEKCRHFLSEASLACYDLETEFGGFFAELERQLADFQAAHTVFRKYNCINMMDCKKEKSDNWNEYIENRFSFYCNFLCNLVNTAIDKERECLAALRDTRPDYARLDALKAVVDFINSCETEVNDDGNKQTAAGN